MTAMGWDFQAGCHDGLDGFYAVFFHEWREDVDDWEPPDWFTCGHAHTLLDAINMARRLALGEITDKDIPGVEVFRK